MKVQKHTLLFSMVAFLLVFFIIGSIILRILSYQDLERHITNNKAYSDLYWLPAQMEKNLNQLSEAVYQYCLGHQPANIQEKLDILASRLDDLNNPSYGGILPSYKEQEYKQYLEEIKHFLVLSEKKLVSGNYANIQSILIDLAPLKEKAIFYGIAASEQNKVLMKESNKKLELSNIINDLYLLIMLIFFVITIKLYNAWKIARHDALTTNNEKRAQTTILAIVSHEMRGPLQTLLLNISSLENKLNRNLAVKPILDVIKLSTNQIIYQLNGLIDGAELQSGKMTILPDWVDNIASTISNIVHTYHAQASKKAIRLAFHHGEIPTLFMDEKRYGQITSNLVANAIQHTDVGQVAVSLAFKENSLILTVTDSGEGFPAGSVEKAFEPFSKLENQRRGGTGMGLAIVDGIVKLMNGNITIASQPALGTTICVSIPVTAKPQNHD